MVRGAERADLALLYEPEVMLVTAPIAPSAHALRGAQALLDAGPRQSTVEVRNSAGVPIPGELDHLAANAGEFARAWVSYLEQVSGLFADLFDARVVGVRQIVADGPHCPRFHVDQVLARGVLNVLGACTEWVDEADIDRSRLGHAGGAEDAHSGLVRPGSPLERAELGTLAVFKGTAWPGASERAIVHRSPPPDGRRRLMLTLDWLQ